MRFLPAWKYQLDGVKWPVVIYYGVIAALVVLGSIAMAFVQNDGVMIRSIEMSSMIFLFVMGLNSFKSVFFMMSANGISRKTMFVSFVAMVGTVSAGMALIDTIFSVCASGGSATMFELIYNIKGTATASGFVWRLCTYLVIAMAGYLITTLYYRMSKAVKLLVSIGVPVLVLFVWPAVDYSLLNGVTTDAVGRLISWASGLSTGNPYIAVMSDIVLTVLFGALSWVAMRRAPVKTKTA